MKIKPLLAVILLFVAPMAYADTQGQEQANGNPHTSSGTINPNCRTVTFIANGSFSGTVLGVPLQAGAGLTIAAQTGDTLGPIAYTVSAGTLYSIELRR